MPYNNPSSEEVRSILTRIYDYLAKVTSPYLIDQKTGNEITDYSKFNPDAIFAKGDFRIISYEWGVTYSAMLLAGEVTGDARFFEYTNTRLQKISKLYPVYKEISESEPGLNTPLRSVVEPRTLDDAGSMCAAMLKTMMKNDNEDFLPMIENFHGFY